MAMVTAMVLAMVTTMMMATMMAMVLINLVFRSSGSFFSKHLGL